MADAEKEKAEKLAAAKKRFEQLKKEQQKKGKKGATKKKDEQPAESKGEEAVVVEDGAAADDTVEVQDATETTTEDGARPEVSRRMSVSAQSKQRSESFRQGTAPVSPGAEVQDLYHKQAARIEELERENKAVKEEREREASRLTKTEEELEGLREGSSDVAELKTQAKEAERLRVELASVQRQLSQAQQTAKGSQRRVSGTTPDLTEQLASKTSSIEALELELSNVRNEVNGLQSTLSERDASAKDLEERAQVAEAATESAKQELDALKVSMTFPSEETKAAAEDPEALTKRITILESDLRTAKSDLDAAGKRAASLEQKIEALTKLHRNVTTTSQAKDKELNDLRTQIRRTQRPSHVRDASEFELGEEETETGVLQARIRALEAENFDLRRGVWRDKRAELQPGMDDDQNGPEYEDVDLNGPYAGSGRRESGSRAQHSTFQDVITSGISAFTGVTGGNGLGRPRGSTGAHARKQSLGLLSEDDDDFDPQAFQQAQEEEAKRRIERVKEVKRGLDKWKNWKIDIAEMRANAAGVGRDYGPVFEV